MNFLQSVSAAFASVRIGVFDNPTNETANPDEWVELQDPSNILSPVPLQVLEEGIASTSEDDTGHSEQPVVPTHPHSTSVAQLSEGEAPGRQVGVNPGSSVQYNPFEAQKIGVNHRRLFSWIGILAVFVCGIIYHQQSSSSAGSVSVSVGPCSGVSPGVVAGTGSGMDVDEAGTNCVSFNHTIG